MSRSLSHSCLSRRAQKYTGRQAAIAQLLEDAQGTTSQAQDPIALRKWEMIEEVNEALGIEGQSSEESDTNPDTRLPNHHYALKVTRPAYRHSMVGELMNDVDKSIDKLRNTDTRRLRHRVRMRTIDKSTNSVKKGLPTALYDSEFLQKLNPLQRNQVRPSDAIMPRFSAYVTQVNFDRMRE